METLGEILKNQRKAKNLTLEELSKKVGISEVSLGSYERNQSKPLLIKLSALCNALDLDYDELFAKFYK